MIPDRWYLCVIPYRWYFCVIPDRWYFCVIPDRWYFCVIPDRWYFCVMPDRWYICVMPDIWYLCVMPQTTHLWQLLFLNHFFYMYILFISSRIARLDCKIDIGDTRVRQAVFATDQFILQWQWMQLESISPRLQNVYLLIQNQSYTACNVECIVTRYIKDALNISLENTEFQMSSYTRGANYLLSNHTLNVMSNV